MTVEELLRENEQLRVENVQLRKRLAELETQVKALQGQLLTIQRASKRQAAPFSKGEPKADPKRPGRKPGHTAEFRARPTPAHVSQSLEAPLPAACPECGGALVEDKVEAQYQVDIPKVEPVTTQFNVHIGHCTQCGRRVQGRHAEQTSDALGAANLQIGPRALSLAAQAKHELGVPYGKISRFFAAAFGLVVCRAALARAGQRLARAHAPGYAYLQFVLRLSAVVWVDETGWKVAGHSAWLWVFTSTSVTVYVIDPRRGHEVVERLLGEEFAGLLECDCFLAYDPLGGPQQKCLQHLLRRCEVLQTVKTGRAAQVSREVARLLRVAIHLWHRYRDQRLSERGYRVACGRLEAALDRLLNRRVRDPDNVG